MTRTRLGVPLALHGIAAGLLMGGVAFAQGNPNPNQNKDKPAAKAPAAPQPSANKNADKPANDPAKGADKSKKDTAPDKSDRTAEKKDAAADRKATASDKKEAPAEKKEAATEKRDAAAEKRDAAAAERKDAAAEKKDAASQKETPKSDRQAETKDRDSTNRSNAQAADRAKKEVTASDLGLTFSEETSDKGLKITKFSSKGIASKLNFREGDIIVSVNDHRARTDRDFVRWINANRDDRITVIVLRDDREVTVYLEPDVIFQETVVSQSAWLGVDLEDRVTDAAVVRKVHPNSPAERAGVKSGDVILAVEQVEISSPEHLGQVIGKMRPGDEVEIRVERNRQKEVVDATLGRRESVSQRTEVVPGRPSPCLVDSRDAHGFLIDRMKPWVQGVFLDPRLCPSTDSGIYDSLHDLSDAGGLIASSFRGTAATRPG